MPSLINTEQGSANLYFTDKTTFAETLKVPADGPHNDM